MTSGKWIILILLGILASLLTFAIKEKHPPTTDTDSSDPVESTIEINEPPPKAARTIEAMPVETKEEDSDKTGRQLRVIVQDEYGRPLSDALVRLIIRAEKSRSALTNFNSEVLTDITGVSEVRWPTEPFKQLEIVASKPNYSSRKMVWDFETGDTVPQSYTISLKQGFHIGGIVVDPEGHPISDAKITISRFWRGGEDGPKKKGEETAFSRQKWSTGVDGFWNARDLPTELIDRISIRAEHTNFIGASISLQKSEVEKQLRDGTHRLVLERGLDVFGRVLDEQGMPIANAKVWAGRKFSPGRQATKSDDQGGFVFRNVSEGEMLFSVMADGYEPTSKSQKISAQTPEVVFRLSKGTVIAGKVVNKAGEPIQGVRVVLEGSFGEPSYDHYEFSTTTDKEGTFEWTSAPNQPMPFYIGKTGYQQKRDIRLKPGEENIVTLFRNREVRGQVLDAETGLPITEFRIATGRGTMDRFHADSHSAKDFTSPDGLFSIEVSEEQNNGIQASAKDYAEQVQALQMTKGEEPAEVVFRLKPSPALEGVVIMPNGQPVPGASVALVEEKFGGRSVRFSNGRMTARGSGSKIVTTDPSGRFSIPSPVENGTLVASSEEGFASASLAEVRASGVLTLQLFGRIEGVLFRGSYVAEDQELLLSSPNDGIFFDFEGYQVTSDANGRFVFEKVPSGNLSIVRLIKTTSNSWRHSHKTSVTVTPGQTTHVTLGGVDATVQGRVRFETEPTEADLTIAGMLSTPVPPVPSGLSPEERKAFFDSPEWKEQIQNRKHYSVVVEKDGSLVLDSVAPGDYTLTLDARKASDNSFNSKPVARGETKVTVPVGAGPSSPIDIGEIILRP